MIELEVAEQTRDAIWWGLEAFRLSGVTKPEGIAATRKMHEFWKRRVKDIKCEPARETGPGCFEIRIGELERTVAELRKDFTDHQHYSATTGGGYAGRGHL